MRITQELYAALRAAIHARFEDRLPIVLEAYRAAGKSDERFRWDVLHASGFDTRQLYDAGLNDQHIDTALRGIVAVLS